MKKDYIPVSNENSALSEVAFIDKYWTDIWNKHDQSLDLSSQIERKEEFKIMGPYLESCKRRDKTGTGVGVKPVRL